MLLTAAVAPAHGDVTINLRAKDPVAALPAVSSDGVNFLRPYRRWRKACKTPDLHVEMGGIDRSALEPDYANAQLLGCGQGVDTYEGNVSMINESLHETRCSTAPDRGTMKAALPATFTAATFTVTVTGDASSALVLADPITPTRSSRAGERRMDLRGAPLEVHAWYLVDRGLNHALAVNVSVREQDGTIGEQWIDVWLDAVPAKPDPVAVARAWLRASARYGTSYDPRGVEKITAKKLPKAFAKQQKAFAKAGTTVVLYESDAGTIALGIRMGKVALFAETPTE
ncbi:MAG TPA: hypothetical protein VM261_08505 [Kofleriaceae bacterium]|nr:hypothetical protein [Kofleriaceae bacterium]